MCVPGFVCECQEVVCECVSARTLKARTGQLSFLDLNCTSLSHSQLRRMSPSWAEKRAG